jgi:thymidylate synthase (FAD)
MSVTAVKPTEVPSFATVVLPGGGWIGLIDIMGGESCALDAARTSVRDALVYDGLGDVNVTPSQHLRDEELLHYLVRHGHWSVFDQVQLKFLVHLPIFVARQWMRHWSHHFNERSARYKQVPCEIWVPSELRLQNVTGNKQGSDRMMVPPKRVGYTADSTSETLLNGTEIAEAEERQKNILTRWHALAEMVYAFYDELCTAGVARELARGILPQSEMTTMMATISLRDVIMFCMKRNSPDAQKEIQCYAAFMELTWARAFPRIYMAYLLYMRGAVTIPLHALPFLEIKRNRRGAGADGLGVLLSASGIKLADEAVAQVSTSYELLSHLPYGRVTPEYPEGTPAPDGELPRFVRRRLARYIKRTAGKKRVVVNGLLVEPAPGNGVKLTYLSPVEASKAQVEEDDE